MILDDPRCFRPSDGQFYIWQRYVLSPADLLQIFRSPTWATMKGVVLWANPDRQPLARATNTNRGQLPANRFNVKTGSEAEFRNDHKKPPGSILPCIYLGPIKRNTLQRSSFIHIPCGRIGPRGLASTSLCDPRIATMAYWPCSCSLLSLALILSYRFVAEIIRLVNPLCCNFFKKAL